MKILILGGTGAMGRPLVKNLSTTQPEADIHVTSRRRQPDQDGTGRVRHLLGNARDNSFLNDILTNGGGRYDIIVDFMNYDLDEFAARMNTLLSSCSHYIWFSSARVYAESEEPLSETSPRLLETSTDTDFLATNRYALRKARQENLLTGSGFSNYTIIRPYITYNNERLQLGICEKEQWLYRLLKGRPLVLSRTMLDKTTTLTFGGDVAEAITDLIGNNSAKGRIFQIAGTDTITWRELLELYCNIITVHTGFRPKVFASDSIKDIEMLYEGGYNTIYDRNFNRTFNSARINEAIGREIDYTPIREGVTRCLTDFLSGDRKFLRIDPAYEAYQDLITDSYSDKTDFTSDDDWHIYLSKRDPQLTDISNPHPHLEQIL